MAYNSRKVLAYIMCTLSTIIKKKQSKCRCRSRGVLKLHDTIIERYNFTLWQRIAPKSLEMTLNLNLKKIKECTYFKLKS